MRFFRHTIAEYTCTEHCGHHVSLCHPNLSLFFILTAGVATIPLWIASLCEPWDLPWYYLVCILAGEIVLLHLASFIKSFLSIPFNQLKFCKQCGAPMFFAGQHYDPKGSKYPTLDDIIILFIFILLNISIWIVFASGYFINVFLPKD